MLRKRQRSKTISTQSASGGWTESVFNKISKYLHRMLQKERTKSLLHRLLVVQEVAASLGLAAQKQQRGAVATAAALPTEPLPKLLLPLLLSRWPVVSNGVLSAEDLPSSLLPRVASIATARWEYIIGTPKKASSILFVAEP